MVTALKLRAEDSVDLAVLASYLQDAVVQVRDIAWQPQHHRFAIILNRYVWEQDNVTDTDANQDLSMNTCQRIRTGLHFNGILKVSSHDLPRHDKSHILELLTISGEKAENDQYTVTLIFAGGGAIRLHAECIEALMSDIGDPWPAKCLPHHKILDEIPAKDV